MENLINKWHKAILERDFNVLDDILADDVVFYSPVLFTEQRGKTITKMYLTAAFHVLGGEEFKYHKEIISGNQACLEFSTAIGDIIINGVDIITTNEEGKIIEFKVMVRPLKAMMAMKEKMYELLQKMGAVKK